MRLLTKPDNQALVNLYKTDKKLCTIIVLCQGNSHGIAPLSKTKNDDDPNRLTWEFIEKTKKADKPSDASAIIEMDVELD